MKKISYETNMEKLSEIVDTLTNGDVGLEEALKLFEQGVKLSNSCYESLKKAEQKITELSELEEKAEDKGDDE